MTTQIGVLPLDLLDAVTQNVNEHVASTTSFLRLAHPRTGIPALFLPYRLARHVDAEWGFLEVQSVSPPNQRSWFFTEGQVISDGKLLVMTPIDPTFLLIPILQAVKPVSICLEPLSPLPSRPCLWSNLSQNDGSAGLFQPLDDIFDEAAPKIVRSVNERTLNDDALAFPPISAEDMLSLTKYDCIINALNRICDFQNITPELTVYRYSEDKVLEYLQAKVSRLSKHAVAEKSRTITRGLAKDGLMDDGKEDLLELGRLRIACNLVSQYVAHVLYSALIARYDFTTLDAHIKALKDEEIALGLANAPAKKARAADKTEDDGNKRKAKTKASQGVEKLKKANLSGMAKISSFFQKK